MGPHVSSTWSGVDEANSHIGGVSTSGSSVHCWLTQMSAPEQSSPLLHGPVQSEIAFTRSGEVVVKRIAIR